MLDTVRHMSSLSRNIKTDAKQLRRGLAIYRTPASPYWYVRVWLPAQQRYLVRSTKEKSRVKALEAAEEIVSDLRAGKQLDWSDSAEFAPAIYEELKNSIQITNLQTTCSSPATRIEPLPKGFFKTNLITF